MIRWTLLILLLGLGSCFREGHYKNVEIMPHEWKIPPEEKVHRVTSMPILYENLRDYVREMQEDGWRVESYEQAGEFLPQKYIVVFYRPKS